MKKTSLLTGAGLGAITSIPVMAAAYLLNHIASAPVFAFDLFDWAARTLPGEVVTMAIDAIVGFVLVVGVGPTSEVAKWIERISAIAIFVLLGALFGALLAYIGRSRAPQLALIGTAGGVVWSMLSTLVQAGLRGLQNDTISGIAGTTVLFMGWGALLGWLIRSYPDAPDMAAGAAVTRRNFLAMLGGSSLAITLGASWAALSDNGKSTSPAITPAENIDLSLTQGPAVSPPEDDLISRIPPAPGTRPEITSNADFYTIDINSFPPSKDPGYYRLEIAGLVDTPISLSLEELRARPALTQAITLSCISNPVGGDLIGTSLWTGVSLKSLLEEAGLKPDARALFIEADDGFYETVDLEVARDERTLLVYDMNGVPLPRAHGFPVRIYIPDRYGMKQPKWITRIVAINHAGRGYWVDRGWSREALVNTTSMIDHASVSEAGGQLTVGGIAYSGAKGISKVEVQVDDGEWMQAELREPALSPLTWIQWRLDIPSVPGRRDFRVRAYDAAGQLQETSERGARPDGATGIHSLNVNLS
jgi:DMSO/TMAO reductase YedYZ molybdopterin-dependent catalytic subunit